MSGQTSCLNAPVRNGCEEVEVLGTCQEPDTGKLTGAIKEYRTGIIQSILIHVLRLYKGWISPLLGDQCRFYPSCSVYSIQVIEKYGVIKGIYLSAKRILKCNPFHPGGIDLP